MLSLLLNVPHSYVDTIPLRIILLQLSLQCKAAAIASLHKHCVCMASQKGRSATAHRKL